MLRVLYAGSPKESADVLITLASNSLKYGYEIVAVLTNTPKSKGRHKALIPTPVALAANTLKIPLIESDHCDSATRAKVVANNPDILVCFAYGRIFGPKFMATFSLGGINLHPSLLPRWRGPAPANFAILSGDTKTGLSIQKITQSLDSGELIAQSIIQLNDNSTAGYIMEKAATDGALMLLSTLADISKNGTVPRGVSQSGDPTFSTFITKENTHLTFDKSATSVSNFVRAFNPTPLAWSLLSDNGVASENSPSLKIIAGCAISDDKIASEFEQYKNLKCGTVCFYDKNIGIAIRCCDGYYFIKNLQLQGKNPLDHKAFMNGARGFIKKILV